MMARILHFDRGMTGTRFATASIRGPEPMAREERARAALARIERGTFGLCITCERPIERDRLDHAPLTEECERCAQGYLQERRPQ